MEFHILTPAYLIDGSVFLVLNNGTRTVFIRVKVAPPTFGSKNGIKFFSHLFFKTKHNI